MRNPLLLLMTVFVIFQLVACTSISEETPLVDVSIIENAKDSLPELNSSKFGEQQHFRSNDSVIELTTEQKNHFITYYKSSDNRDTPGHQRLYEYLQSFGETFVYGNLTSDAKSTLDQGTGNCMSLAVLTTALAKAVDIEIKYQLVNRIPVFQEYGSVVFNAQHIRSIVYKPRNEDIADLAGTTITVFRESAIIDYYPSRSNFSHGFVSEDEFYAMYFRNLASEAIGQDNNNRAYWLLKHSLEIEPESHQTINSLAILHRRVGDYRKAEELYKYGIKIASNKIVLLKNYKVLLLFQKRYDEAEKISRELENLEDHNPFNWLLAANDAFDEEDFNLACTT